MLSWLGCLSHSVFLKTEQPAEYDFAIEEKILFLIFMSLQKHEKKIGLLHSLNIIVPDLSALFQTRNQILPLDIIIRCKKYNLKKKK